MDINEKSLRLEEIKGCAICTSWLHSADKCWAKNKPNNCQIMEMGKKCGKKHDSSLHGSTSKYCQVNAAIKKQVQCDLHKDELLAPSSPVLLRIQEIMVGTGAKKEKTLVLFDPGSTATLITHDFAQQLGLVGVEVTYYLKVVGQGYTQKKTMAYKLTLMDNQKKKWKLDMLGIEAITSVDAEADLSEVKPTFPDAPRDAFIRPAGPVNLLIGSNYEAMQPFNGQLKGGLRLLKSHFGCGKVFSGSDPKIKFAGDKVSAEAMQMTTSVRELPEDATTADVFHASLKLPNFMEAEELGTAPARHCKKCRDCKQCSYRGRMITRDDEMVVKMVEDSMWLDEANQAIHVSYPWKPEAESQVSNHGQALAIQKKVEAKLLKAGRLEEYNLEMSKQI